MTLQKDLEDLLSNLDFHIKLISDMGKISITMPPGIYAFDIYVNGILNRSVNLIRGYILLMKDNNFIAAAPLVRLHLDSLLRLYAPQLIDFNVDDLALKILGETSLRSIKDKEGKKLTDQRLVEKLKEVVGFEWIENVYNTGNAYVHYSDQPLLASLQKTEEERIVRFTIGRHDEFVPLTEKHGSAFWMNKISEGIVLLMNSWIEQKESYTKNGG